MRGYSADRDEITNNLRIGCFRLRAILCFFVTLVKLDETARMDLGKQREERKRKREREREREREALERDHTRREYPVREKTE